MPIGFDRNSVRKPETATARKAAQKQHGPESKTGKKELEREEAEAPREKPSPDEEFDDSDDFDVERTPKKDRKMLYIAIGIVLLIVLSVAYTMLNGSNRDNATVSDTETVDNRGLADDEDPYVYDEDGNPIYSADGNEVINGDAIDPGDVNYTESTQRTTTAKVYSTDDYLKDINGVDISAVYNITSRDYVYDYVSYVAKRGIIDDGMEIYWLEADYKGRKYRIQVPFLYFKDFDEKGVCRVQIEVLNIEGGGKVISYMQVVDNSAGVSAGEE